MATDVTPTSVKALYDFRGTNNDELNFGKGDIITITQIQDGGWWEGTFDGKTGWFPSNYVKENKEGVEVSGTADKVASPQKTVSKELLSIRQETIKLYRNVVLNDIIDSEKNHLNDLQGLQKSYLLPLQLSDTLTTSDFAALVGNLNAIVEIHNRLLNSLEHCVDVNPRLQKIGGAFIYLATQMKNAHLLYSFNHPNAVKIMEKYKNEISGLLESLGAPSPGIRTLTAGLSKPFKRLEKYRGLLLELEHHIEESHPDRGDTQRAAVVYNDISEACSKARRQREMELDILQNNICGWEGEEPEKLGDIILMKQMAIMTEAHEKQLRHLVLFPTTLVFLSVSSRMSTFVYEGKLPLTGISASRVPDSDHVKNAFEISGNMIDKIIVMCQNSEEQINWVDALKQQIRFSVSPGSSNCTPFNSHVVPTTSGLLNSSEIKPSTSVKMPYQPSDQVWRNTCLRPSPPMRPFWALNANDDSNSGRKAGFNPFNKSKVGQSFDGDNRILRVIEAYCMSAKSRNTVSSSLLDCPQVLIAEEEKIINEVVFGNRIVVEEKSLVDTVYALKDQMKDLQREVKTISKTLNEEQVTRKKLEEMLRKCIITGSET